MIEFEGELFKTTDVDFKPEKLSKTDINTKRAIEPSTGTLIKIDDSETEANWNRTADNIRRDERNGLRAVERMIKTGDPLTPEQQDNNERVAKALQEGRRQH